MGPIGDLLNLVGFSFQLDTGYSHSRNRLDTYTLNHSLLRPTAKSLAQISH